MTKTDAGNKAFTSMDNSELFQFKKENSLLKLHISKIF